jgi:RNA polymerase sigma-70 factor (ECF subfamily)
MHATDLALTSRCLAGDTGAIAELEATVFPAVVHGLARRDLEPWRDEILQRVRVVLFTPANGRGPELAAYTGRGPLRAWITVIAMRIGFKLARRDGREVASEPTALLDALTDPASDPSLAHAKQLYRTQFRSAFLGALATLDQADRNLLRQSLLERRSIDELAKELGIHRATAARRIQQVKTKLLEQTRRTLASELDVSHGVVDSIIALVRSQIDLSLERVL